MLNPAEQVPSAVRGRRALSARMVNLAQIANAPRSRVPSPLAAPRSDGEAETPTLSETELQARFDAAYDAHGTGTTRRARQP